MSESSREDGAMPNSGEASQSKNLTRRQFLGAGAAGALALGVSPTLAKYRSLNLRAHQAAVTLKLMSWEPFGESPEFPAWTKVVNEFMAANPHIKVKWTGWPFATYDTNVIAQAQAGQVDADVVMAPPEAASTLIAKYNMAVPLQSIAHQLGLIPIPAHKQFEMHGNLYGLGVIDVAFALVYDQRILRNAGIKTPPKTPAQWLDVVKATTKPPNQFGVSLINTVAAQADWWNQLQNFCLPFGGSWAKGNTLTIDSPANVKGIEFWLELLNASGLKGTSETALTKLNYNDQVATIFNVAAGLSNYKTLAPKLYPNMRSTPPPWEGRKAIARLHPLLVMKSSPYRKEAMELVKWCVTPKNLYYLTVTNGYPIIPFSNFGKFEPGYQHYLTHTPWLPGFLETNYVGEFNILGEFTYAYSQIGNIIAENLERAVSGSATVKQALQGAQQQAKESLHV